MLWKVLAKDENTRLSLYVNFPETVIKYPQFVQGLFLRQLLNVVLSVVLVDWQALKSTFVGKNG
ncbi:MAG: hypothetical protein ACI86X_001332 [Moritella sp.]|jgi:hypothetical protein